MEFWDAWLYVVAQFSGAIAGVALARYVLQGALGHHAVRYAVTVPGVYGSTVAFAAESAISFFLMTTVLFVTNHKILARYTAYFLGVLIAALWIYFIAPSMGILAAGEVFLRVRRGAAPYCAKLHHANHEPYIFHHAEHEV